MFKRKRIGGEVNLLMILMYGDIYDLKIGEYKVVIIIDIIINFFKNVIDLEKGFC